MYLVYIVLILVVLIAIGVYLYRKYFIKTKEKLENTSKETKSKQILDTTKEYYLKDPNNNEILLNSFFNDIIVNNKVSKDKLIEQLELNKKQIQNDYEALQVQKQQVAQLQQDLTLKIQEAHNSHQAYQAHLAHQSSQSPQQPPQPYQQQPPQSYQQQQLNQNQPQQSQTTTTEKKQRPKLSHPSDKADNIALSEIEDENIAALNLTNDEMIELKKQILALKKSQKQQISAQNDEDEEDDDEEDSD
jgi:hypothetical protein